MAPQTSYSIDIPAVSFPGHPVDVGYKDDLSVVAASATLPYGRLIVKDSAKTAGFDKLAGKLPAAGADITTGGNAFGVALADQGRAQDPTFAVPTYPQFAMVPCRRKGRVWVIVEEAVADNDPVYVRFADGTVTGNNGGFRKSADTATAALLPNAVYRGASISVGGVLYAVVQLSLL
jgi:hypothetical protein